MIKRKIPVKSNIKEMSILLLGPRQTGKSTFLVDQLMGSGLNDVIYLDLLDPEVYRDFQKTPQLLVDISNQNPKKIIIVDEIQKVPELLDVAQVILSKNKDARFIFTGSSARKIRKQTDNLLGGRLYPLYMHPFTSNEYAEDNIEKINKLIQFGGLPSVVNSDQPLKRLKAYTGIYLQEEIKAEGYVKNLSDFSHFLDVAALTNTEQLDYNQVASDVQVSARTVASYYQILVDTMCGYLLEPYRKTKTRKAVATPKFYFFDVGVANYLAGREKIILGTPEYGKAFEHFVFTELLAYRDYSEKEFKIYYWRSTSQMEVDFIIETKNKELIGLEVKSSKIITEKNLSGLKAFEDDFKFSKKIVVSLTEYKKTMNGTEVINISDFCKRLWAGEIF